MTYQKAFILGAFPALISVTRNSFQSLVCERQTLHHSLKVSSLPLDFGLQRFIVFILFQFSVQQKEQEKDFPGRERDVCSKNKSPIILKMCAAQESALSKYQASLVLEEKPMCSWKHSDEKPESRLKSDISLQIIAMKRTYFIHVCRSL